jgi:probable HAF family extracellular repeat protein
MKTKSISRAASLNSRLLIGLAFCSAGLLLALAGSSKSVPGMIAMTSTANSVPTDKPQHYRVIDLGTLGGTFGYAGAINNRDWADGAATLPGDTAQHAVLWRSGRKINIGTFGGPNSGVFGKGLNERGQVVGAAETSMPDPLDQDFCGFGTGLICAPLIWQQGVMTQLPTLGGYNGIIYDINNRGIAAGQAQSGTLDQTCDFSVQQTKPVLWVNGQIHELPTIAGDTGGSAYEINDHGQAVGATGNCQVGEQDIFALHAVLWANGTVTDLGNLGGMMNNSAFDINNHGQVVGTSDLPGDTTGHAFLWENGVMTDLGTLGSDLASGTGGINDKGQIVGQSCDVTEGNCRAFLWQNGVMKDLNTLIPHNSPLFLAAAFDINAEGQIAGIAFVPSSQELHAFLASPCEDDQADPESCEDRAEAATAASDDTREGRKSFSRKKFVRCFSNYGAIAMAQRAPRQRGLPHPPTTAIVKRLTPAGDGKQTASAFPTILLASAIFSLPPVVPTAGGCAS